MAQVIYALSHAGCDTNNYDEWIFQTTEGYFNKGSLFNAGVLEIERRFPSHFDCMVLQDVDVLPETDGISYACRETAWHLAAYVDKFEYKWVHSSCTGLFHLVLSC